MPKNRLPLQVDPMFKERLNELQRQLMRARGEKVSFRDITKDIISSPLFKDIENNMIKSGDINMDLKIRLDRRIFQ